mgnify:CR=1 FL=1
MMAARIGDCIAIAPTFADACALFKSSQGYTVKLHCAPKYTFFIDAPSGDAAQRLAAHVAKSEGLPVPTDAATFSKRGQS